MKFEFHSVPRIVFGRGQFARVGELAAELGHKALVITNVGLPGDGGVVDRLVGLLDQADVASVVRTQAGEPQVADLDHALGVADQEACTLVVGLGGGSAIDAAKATAALITNRGQAGDYMEVVGKGLPITQPAAAWIAIPTTAGTGAEVTRNAVIGWKEKRFKASIRSPHLLARVALVDPELTATAPPQVTACCGMDALCQLIESYTATGATPLTDGLALEGVALAGRSLRIAYAEPANLDARESMSAAALLSGITLTNAGLGAVHGLAAPLGANLPIPHGAACAALLAPVIRANLAALRAQAPAAGPATAGPANAPSPTDGQARHSADQARNYLARYAAIGRALLGRRDLDDDPAADAVATICTTLASELSIPPLSAFGLTPALADQIAELAQKSSSMRYNPVPLSVQTLTEILLQAM